MTTTKKLIEVALPLDAINKASAREKSIRHGHPSTLHLWWARRPLAAARAVIFSQMVDDPSSYEPDEAKAERERQRLFAILEDLVLWENTTNEAVLQRARDAIRESWRRTCAVNADHPRASELFDPEKLPAFHDPFAGGGALPLEAQRLGLESYASDLNPVAVLINKAMIEIPPRFAGKPPINPASRQDKDLVARQWTGALGLAEDVRYYGQWMRDEAEKRIGWLYPKVAVTADMAQERPDLKPYVGRELTVIAWLWARTVKSPNPAFANVDVPLASTFMLSTKKGKEAYVEPVIEDGGYRFTVKVGVPEDADAVKRGTKAGGSHSSFLCLMSGTPMPFEYLRSEGRAGRLGTRLIAIVAEGDRKRVYLAPTNEHEAQAHAAQPVSKPEVEICHWPGRTNVVEYGLTTFGNLFTPRQLVALTTFSDLVSEAQERVKNDYLGARASRPRRGQDALAPHALPPHTIAPPAANTAGVKPSTPYHRTHLPHFEAGAIPQHICFRLADSLPKSLLEQWEDELRRLPETEQQNERRQRIETALDQGHGECLLNRPEVAAQVRDALRYFDGDRYHLHGWVIMPNHVHVLVTLLGDNTLSGVAHSWKSYTAQQANQLLGRTGAFWNVDYFDRFMRDEKHFAATLDYIHWNPVKAGLCAKPDDWQWTSYHEQSPQQEGSQERRQEGGHEERGHPALDEGGTPSLPGPATMVDDERPLRDGGAGATAYAEAVGVYLGIALSRLTDICNALCRWEITKTQVRNLFGRQAIPMVWDFAENNVFGDAAGDYKVSLSNMTKALDRMPKRGYGNGSQVDAQTQVASVGKIISADPPYYDNIGYADLSDFFYVWLRRSLRSVFPDLFATLAVPKSEELVATPYRHGNRQKAEAFFLTGMTQAVHRLAEQAHPGFPVTIYYAFKQSETKGGAGTVSTGWETFLDAVIKSGFAITGTWPMRTELSNRMIGADTNALASSIVLVCRQRPTKAPLVTRREFVSALKTELPTALTHLQRGNIAPVDLAQAAIGPGMAIFTRYAKVLDTHGQPLPVREALALINQTLDEVLAEQEGDFDADTRWALAWFEQAGFEEGDYGVAETLSKAKNTSVDGLAEAGILAARGGKVRLLKPDELADDWDPVTDPRLTAWESVHHLVHILESDGEGAAAELTTKLGSTAETARELCYRLYTLCERKKRAAEALSYNSLVQSWPEITRLAQERQSTAEQATLFPGAGN